MRHALQRRRTGGTLAAMMFGAVAVFFGAGDVSAGPAWDYQNDLLYVAYVPGGNEIIVNLGPKSQFTSATGPITITRFTAQDLRDVLNGGSPLSPDTV